MFTLDLLRLALTIGPLFARRRTKVRSAISLAALAARISMAGTGSLQPVSPGQGSLVGPRPMETNRVGLHPEGQSPVGEAKSPSVDPVVHHAFNHTSWLLIAEHLASQRRSA